MLIQPLTIEAIFQEAPVDMAECHASTLLPLPNNEYLCAWFAGIHEGHPNTAIWLSHRYNECWSTPQQIAKVNQSAHWNPVLFQDDGKIYLFFKIGSSPREWCTYWAQIYLQQHSCNGLQATTLEALNGHGPVKNKPIKLKNDDWLAPASIETKTAWDCFCDRSNDQGKTWRQTEFTPRNRNSFPGLGIIQPTLWQSQGEQVHMLMRSTAGKIYRSDSQDNGWCWSTAYPTSLPNNNSGIDLVQLAHGDLVIAYNPVGKNRGRTPLELAFSKDNGETWNPLFSLENDPGEYSYPAVVKTDAGFAVSYTWQRKYIKFWQFTDLL